MIDATPSALMAWITLIPFLAAALVGLTGKVPNLRDGIQVAAGIVTFTLVISLYRSVDFSTPPELQILTITSGLEIAYRLEPLGLLFALIASGLWIVASLYSVGYMRGNSEHAQTRFFACFAISIGSALGLAFSANLLTLLIFYEVLTIATVPLVTHKGTPDAMRAGRVYLGTLIATSVGFLLFAIAGTYYLTGTLDFTEGGILEGHASNLAVVVLLFLYIFGIGKAAVMPVHRWLPAAMVAPTPVSALLHAVAVVKAGVFSVVKVIVYVFGIDLLSAVPGTEWIAYIAGFTILTASIIALRQDNLKRRLAYSTISQLSYVVLAAALFTPLSIIAAALHIVAHAFGKITLFFAAGSIYTAAHKSNISELDGIGRRMPYTMGAFAIAVLSMIGLPPNGGVCLEMVPAGRRIRGGQLFCSRGCNLFDIAQCSLLSADPMAGVL